MGTLIFIQPPSTTTFATPSSPLVATSISSTIALAGYVVCFNDLRSHSYLSFLLELVSITLVSHSTKHHSFYLLRRRTIALKRAPPITKDLPNILIAGCSQTRSPTKATTRNDGL